MLFLKWKEESTHICSCKGVKFLTFVTYALPLVAVSEVPCGYRNNPPPLRNASAEGDFRDFFFTDEETSPNRGDLLWLFSWLVVELSWACHTCLLTPSFMFFLPHLAICCPCKWHCFINPINNYLLSSYSRFNISLDDVQLVKKNKLGLLSVRILLPNRRDSTYIS